MENPLISVIVPIYKVEQYLDKCINSIVNQTYKNLEIILVDDGSPDNCPTICDNWKDKDERIVVIHKVNGGVSTARNTGIKIAKGMYISFVDSDDTIKSNTYEEVIKAINKCEPDIIDFGYEYVSRYGSNIANINKLKKDILYMQKDIRDNILPPLLNLRKDDEFFVFDFVCNKIFKNNIIKSNNLLFDEERRVWEDRMFVVGFLKYAKSYYCLNDCFYNYMDVPNSLSRRYDLNFFENIVKSYLYFLNNFSHMYEFNTKYVNTYWANSIENIIYYSFKQNKDKKEIKSKIQNILSNEIVINWYKNRVCNDKFDYTISNYVVNQNVDKALALYKRKYIRNSVKNVLEQLINKTKYSIVCLLNRK